MTKHHRLSLLALLVLPALLVAACATATGPGSEELKGLASTADGAVARPASEPGSMPVPAAAPELGARQGGEPSAQQPIPIAQAFESDRALILTASVSMQAKDPWSVADRVEAIALGLGGDVLSLAQSGKADRKSATLTVRVPQARFNDALRQIRDIADVDVLSSNVEGKDVTEQFVDLQARLKAKQAEEQRYMALLARAQTIDEILKIDQVLAQVRTQIEQLTGQVNSIKARTTFSTITVQVSPVLPEPVPTPDPRAYDPSKTLDRAVAALASVLRVGLDTAIWGLVFGWIPLVLFGLALLLSRTRGRPVPSV